jgi:sucrose phosphorylase
MLNPPTTADAPPPGYLPCPDYSRPLYTVPPETRRRIRDKLVRLYGVADAPAALAEIERLMKVFCAHRKEQAPAGENTAAFGGGLSEADVILIAYGDMIRSEAAAPLFELQRFAEDFLAGVFNCIHILPFFPYSSDRGFSVMDFQQVDKSLGDWSHITRIRSRFKLMIDLVLNHVSSGHPWFQEFLNDHPVYRHFFISFREAADISEPDRRKIVRPRTTPLLSGFDALAGRKLVWTTFSRDQVDLNYQHWPVLARIIEVMLFYVMRGADFIRLDAVTYLWKQLGTPCVHLPQTHLVVKLLRDILEAVAPHAAIITETNVPHAENITYFGNGRDEAHLVYNFALPPLLLHTFLSGSAATLMDRIADMTPPSGSTAFFNFMDSHDGIGLPGARGLLDPEEIERMADAVRKSGGCVSYKDNGDGTTSPYELNITCYSALNDADPQEPESLKIDRYLAARSIPLVLAGIPGVYLHGLIGSRNDRQAVEVEGTPRSINRQTLDADALRAQIEDETSRMGRVFHSFTHMIRIRRSEKAFHPNAGQTAVRLDDRVFSLLRVPGKPFAPVLCLTNAAPEPLALHPDLKSRVFAENGLEADHFRDLLSGRRYPAQNGRLPLALPPYGVLWLKPE